VLRKGIWRDGKGVGGTGKKREPGRDWNGRGYGPPKIVGA